MGRSLFYLNDFYIKPFTHMKTFILILPIELFSRKEAENIESETFDTVENVPLKKGFQYVELTDFMDMVNNEEFNEQDNWITYVYAEREY